MKLEQVLTALDEKPAFDPLLPFWEDSMACLPAGTPGFLEAGRLRELMEYTGIDPSEYTPVLRVAERILQDEALKRLAWHCRRALYEELRIPADKIRAWPALAGALGGDANYFYFILALASVDYVRAFHRERGLPEEITRATCSDAGRFRPCYVNVRVNVPATLSWLRNCASGNLFKVGRHQYMRGSFRGGLLVFRHAASGDVLALSEAGRKFNSRGYCDGDGGVCDPQAWTASLEMDETHARGFPVSPFGRAVPHEVRLRLDEWILLLVRDTPVLDMHIPPFEPMPVEASGESMREAARFFRRYLPEKNFRAFACNSWLFNPQLQEVLGDDSNIAAWQREQYLYPVPSAKPSGLQFIFGFSPFDLKTAPRNTRLRRGVIERLERGEPWRGGAMFGLPEDLPHFGGQFYRRRWEKVCRRLGLPE